MYTYLKLLLLRDIHNNIVIANKILGEIWKIGYRRLTDPNILI